MPLHIEENTSFRPLFYTTRDTESLTKIFNDPTVKKFDTILGQIRELIKLRHPYKKLTEDDYTQQTAILLNGKTPQEYGVWVYYGWSNTLVHTLDKDEFIEVRTSRNQYKITKEERDHLSKQKIGVVGLSVGQSIAMTLATERVCGELRLADFDTLELSNLNRLRSGISNLGIPKVIIAAREISEIDPYLNIQIFPDGLTEQNIDIFFGTGEDKLSLMVEVCDGLDMKIISRYHAKKLQIPVVMDTNDRGMLDIERFDLDPERPILHGLAGDINPANIKNLTNEEKIPYILKMVGVDTISTRLKASMMEVDQTLNTWPQLASSVQLGGAITTDVCRRILLNQLKISGRFYIDLDELIPDEPSKPLTGNTNFFSNPFKPLDEHAIRNTGDRYFQHNPLAAPIVEPTKSDMDKLMDIAVNAPSAGNNQPWKWYYKNGRLLLMHDRYRSWSWGDYYEMGALMALGTAIESVSLYAVKLGYRCFVQYVQHELFSEIVAEIVFEKLVPEATDSHKILIADELIHRHTNRASGTGASIPEDVIRSIRNELAPFSFTYLSDQNSLERMGKIIASCDRMRLLHQQGHEEFFHEVRWNHEEADKTRDGIEIASIELSESDKAAFKVAKDYNAIKYLYDWNLGNGFKRLSVKSLQTAGGFGIVSVPEFNRQNLLNVGNNIVRAWTMTNYHKVAFYPMLSSSFFFNRLIHGKGIDMPQHFQSELTDLYTEFRELCLYDGAPVFMFRLAISDNKPLKTMRMEKQHIYVS